MSDLLELADRVRAGEVKLNQEIKRALGLTTTETLGMGWLYNTPWLTLDGAKKLHDAILPGSSFVDFLFGVLAGMTLEDKDEDIPRFVVAAILRAKAQDDD